MMRCLQTIHLTYRLTTLSVAALTVAILLLAPWFAAVFLLLMLAAFLAYKGRLLQCIRVCSIGLLAWRARLPSSSLIMIGSCAVSVAVMALDFVQDSLEEALMSSGRDDVVMVMRQASDSQIQSAIPFPDAALLTSVVDPVGRTDGLVPSNVMSAETLVISDVTSANAHSASGIQFQGVSLPAIGHVRPSLHVIAGHMAREGLREVILAAPLARELGNVHAGSTIKIGGETWTVSGIFNATGADAAAIFADVAVVNAVNRHPYFQVVRVKLDPNDSVDRFRSRLQADKRLSLYSVQTTRQFYQAHARETGQAMRTIGTGILAVVSIALLMAALNTTYTVVHARRFELIVLRVTGFEGWMVVAGFVLELMCLCAFGAAIAVLCCWMFLDGRVISTGAAGAGRLILTLRFVPGAIPDALSWALAIGMVGGWFPMRSTAASSLAKGLAGGV